MKICVFLLCVFSLLCFLPLEDVKAQQQETVTGVILDTEGEPLSGASIIILGVSKGAIADYNGKFSLNAPMGGC